MALNTSRIATVRGLPPRFGAGTSGSKIAHCSSVKSLVYCFLLILQFYIVFDNFPNGL